MEVVKEMKFGTKVA